MPGPRPLRACALLASLLAPLAGCFETSEPSQSGGASDGAGTSTADAGCVTLAGFVASGAPEVDGALCFGIALDASEGLACATTATAGVTQCYDSLLDYGYVVRWAFPHGTALEAPTGTSIGTVVQRGAGQFEVATGALRGLCTVSTAPSSARFCAYAR